MDPGRLIQDLFFRPLTTRTIMKTQSTSRRVVPTIWRQLNFQFCALKSLIFAGLLIINFSIIFLAFRLPPRREFDYANKKTAFMDFPCMKQRFYVDESYWELACCPGRRDRRLLPRESSGRRPVLLLLSCLDRSSGRAIVASPPPSTMLQLHNALMHVVSRLIGEL